MYLHLHTTVQTLHCLGFTWYLIVNVHFREVKELICISFHMGLFKPTKLLNLPSNLYCVVIGLLT
jgi:hypothetical protein